MNIIDDMHEKITIMEHILKTIAGCTNCAGCQSLAKQYLDHKEILEDDSKGESLRKS